MVKVLAFAAILAVLISVQVHCTQPTMQDVLEERLKHMVNVTDEGAGLPKISTSRTSPPVIVDQVAQVVSGQVASIEEATEPQACSCESDKLPVTTDQSVKDEKPQPDSRTAKKLKEKAKKYKVVTIVLPEEPEAEPESVLVESSARGISEPSEVVSASIEVPKPKEVQEKVTEAPEEIVESEDLENVKVDKKVKDKNVKRKEEKKSKGNGKREKRSTKKGGKGKNSERKSKESSKGKSKRSKSKK